MYIQAKHAGFTLLELMITVAILAIIASIALPAYNGYIQTSRVSECSNEMALIRLAEEEFFLENNAYFPNPVATSTGVATIETASNGLYTSSYTVFSAPGVVNAAVTNANIAAANCVYAVTSAGGGVTYTITATGQNNLDSSIVLTDTN